MASNKDRPVIAYQTVPRSAHVCVSAGQYMLVWGGYHEAIHGERYLDPADVYIYHIEHKYWVLRSCEGDIPKGTSGACACFVEGLEHLFIFGGHTLEGNTNCLYSLDLKTFTWTNLKPKDLEEECTWPSPRDKFACWSYRNKFYCFGGFGPPIKDYLKDDGKFYPDTSTQWPITRGWNNQILEYDLKLREWNNPKCKGTAPLPRAACGAARFGSDVYIFGGRHSQTRMNDLHIFNLEDYVWSGEIHIEGTCPCGRSWHSFTAVTEETAFLYGGYSNEGIPLSDAWQLNIIFKQWTQITVPNDRPRLWHTSCCSAEGEILVFGGCSNDLLDYSVPAEHCSDVLSFHLQPYRLRRLCREAVFEYRDCLQCMWNTLPQELMDWLVKHNEIEEKKRQSPKHVPGSEKLVSTCAVS